MGSLFNVRAVDNSSASSSFLQMLAVHRWLAYSFVIPDGNCRIVFDSLKKRCSFLGSERIFKCQRLFIDQIIGRRGGRVSLEKHEVGSVGRLVLRMYTFHCEEIGNKSY